MCTMSSDSIVAQARISELESELYQARIRIEQLEKKLDSFIVIPDSLHIWEAYGTIASGHVIINYKGDSNG